MFTINSTKLITLIAFKKINYGNIVKKECTKAYINRAEL